MNQNVGGTMTLRLKEVTDSESETRIPRPLDLGRRHTLDLGNGSEIVYMTKFVPSDKAWTWFDFLNQRIPWTRPTIRVFGRSLLQVFLFLDSLLSFQTLSNVILIRN